MIRAAAFLGLALLAAPALAGQPIKYQYRTVGFVNGRPVVVAVPVRAVYGETGFMRYEEVGSGSAAADPAPRPSHFENAIRRLPTPTYGAGRVTYSRSYKPQPWETPRPAARPQEVVNPHYRPTPGN